MNKLIFISLIALAGCATSDPNRTWVKEWNQPYNSLEEKELLAEKMEKADYIRYSRETAGLVNKNFSSTPADYLERELVFYQIGLAYMNRIQYASYNIEMHKNLGPNYATKLSKGVPEAKAKMGIYMRKLLELPNLHRMSKFLICRMQELEGNWNGCPSDIRNRIQSGALLWEFGNPSTNDHTYLMEDFTGEAERISREKKGGGAITVARTVCAGMLLCAAGFRGNDELVLQGVGEKIGLKIIRLGEYGTIEGEQPL